jgi:hypothetical protein
MLGIITQLSIWNSEYENHFIEFFASSIISLERNKIIHDPKISHSIFNSMYGARACVIVYMCVCALGKPRFL